MSLVTDQMQVNIAHDIGQVLQVALTPASLALNTSVGAGGSSVSQTTLTNGYKNFAFGITSTQAGSVSIQRYLDQAATIPQGAAITGTLTANTAATVNSSDSVPHQSLIITVNNSSGSTATLSNCLFLLQAS